MSKMFFKMALLVVSIIGCTNGLNATNGTNGTSGTNTTNISSINYGTYNYSCGNPNPSSVTYKLVSESRKSKFVLIFDFRVMEE